MRPYIFLKKIIKKSISLIIVVYPAYKLYDREMLKTLQKQVKIYY